jgi:hypothetical protein
MNDKTNNSKPFDPFEMWRGMRDSALDVWAKAMVQAVNTDAYAMATGKTLELYLTAVAPFRELYEKMVTQALQQSNMPTRSDVVSLAERLTNIERRLDDLDAKLEESDLRSGRARAKGEGK